MFLHLIWSIVMHTVGSAISHSRCVWDGSASHPITSKGSTLSCLVVSCSFMVMDRTVFSAICCAWPLRWWSTERVTPGRICSKSSLLVLERDGGSRAWQHAGGLIRPLVKGQMQKAQPEEKAMQDVQPSSSLKLSPKPQLFRCMNKHAQLLSAKVALLALPSTVLFSPGSAKSSSAPDGNMGAEVRKSLFFWSPCHISSSSSLVFTLFLLFQLLIWIPPVLHSCLLGWSITLTDVSFEIEISSCSAKWLTQKIVLVRRGDYSLFHFLKCSVCCQTIHEGLCVHTHWVCVHKQL